MTFRNSATLTALAAILIAAPAYAGSHMEKDGASTMTSADVFMKIDTDSDSALTFTEFANFSEAHGVSTVDAAQEFTRLAGQKSTIDMEGFTDFDMEAFKSHKMDSAMNMSSEKMMAPDSMETMETFDNQPTAVLNRTVTTSTTTTSTMNAEYGDFADFDANADGNVSFKEYSKMRKAQGVTSTTQAAQEFTRLSGGQAMLTAEQYDTARMNDVLNQPSYQAEYRSEAEYVDPNPVISETIIETETETEMVVEPNLDSANPAGLQQMEKPMIDSEMTDSDMLNSDIETNMNVTPDVKMDIETDIQVEPVVE